MNKAKTVLTLLGIAALLAVGSPLTAAGTGLGTPADPATKKYVAKRVVAPIKIDGRLDEPAWEKAEAVSFAAKNGGAPLQATTARVLWDDTHVYFAWDCRDRHIWSTMAERDLPLYNEEVVEVFINPDGDRETYLELEVNPLGVLWDGFVFNNRGKLTGILAWNSLKMQWAAAVEGTLNDSTDTDQGWTVELALPLADIFTAANNPPQAGDRWRFNLYRIDLPHGPGVQPSDPQAWSPVSGRSFHDPDRFGELEFSDEVIK